MSHIRVLICRVDDPISDQMTELAAFDLPAHDSTALQPATAFDDLETTTHETGSAILRRVLQAQVDAALAAGQVCPVTVTWHIRLSSALK